MTQPNSFIATWEPDGTVMRVFLSRPGWFGLPVCCTDGNEPLAPFYPESTLRECLHEAEKQVPTGYYRHSKSGGLYQVDMLAFRADHALVVIYESVPEGRMWIRPMSVWLETVTLPRFQRL